MALSFIGKPISLISHSDVRYRGILAGIDPAASTIQLSNVYSMGTESRRPPAEFIPPVQDPYQYIIFRASEVKDLAVDEPAPRRSVHDDPAVLGASTPAVQQPAGQQQNAYAPYPNQPPPQQAAPSQQARQPQGTAPGGPNQQRAGGAPADAGANNRKTNSVNTAAASMETVERALGDLRVSGDGGRGGGGGRRGRHGGGRGGGGGDAKEIKVPATDFDFQGSNAKFDKSAAAPRKPQQPAQEDDEDTNPSDTNTGKEQENKAYNPQSSFFDSLSSSTQGLPPRGGGGGGGGDRGGGGHRGRGGPGGRNRREEERERNVATFGEPGGVGLMGPGAYVGGWGGYGRRGGRPRRGGSPMASAR
ncbi:hypothetical protein FIBSPDRAFT_917456 [Athelia psychrophila]|uniref:TFG box profile domain-containing protein n=1 Tax=Athelia psychrophila TaxID=1759441 RepID=A0A166S5T3_9AGAM|nr:hypothetical protein FIBSPDRAFT_917456 [Fibularhizoctonia sp. CBS 109695]